MTCTDFPHPAPTTARPDDSILFAALELSRKSWLVATSAPGEEKVSKRTVSAGDGRALLDLLAEPREKADRQAGQGCRDLACQTGPDAKFAIEIRPLSQGRTVTCIRSRLISRLTLVAGPPRRSGDFGGDAPLSCLETLLAPDNADYQTTRPRPNLPDRHICSILSRAVTSRSAVGSLSRSGRARLCRKTLRIWSRDSAGNAASA